MSLMTGHKLKLSNFGQSHSQGMGVVLDGLPAGETIDLERVQEFLRRRAPGQGPWATARKEEDRPEILSGLVDGKTCGAPLCAVIANSDARSADYEELRRKPRPGHADYTAWVRYQGYNDIRGGGQFSGRLTAPLSFAGAVALQILERRGIYIGAHIAAIAGISDRSYDPVKVSAEDLALAGSRPFPVLCEASGKRMMEAIDKARQQMDSVGGVVECAAIGLPAGLGEPMFDGVENRLAAAIFAIPAVKGVEFGEGFGAALLRGSQNNDPFLWEGEQVVTSTNHHGGILGGITSGMPVIFRVAFKPTPSIAQEQQTVDLYAGTEATLGVRGRHDPCIVPRAVPCVEAAAAVTLLDLLLEG